MFQAGGQSPMHLRFLCATWLLLPSLAGADVTADDVERCMRRNAPERASIPSLSIQSVDRSGESSEAAARVYWHADEPGGVRVVLRMTEPDDVRGTSVLMVGGDRKPPELFVYLPDLSKVKRVRKRHLDRPLLGTDFSFEDFERIRGMSGRTRFALAGERWIHGRRVWVLDGRAESGEDSAYERFLIYVDQEYCVPLRTEFIGAGNELRKVLTALPEHITREGRYYVPRRLAMRDLRDRTETTIAVNEIHVDDSPPADLFTLGGLAAGSD
jgi:hypothetical protein